MLHQLVVARDNFFAQYALKVGQKSEGTNEQGEGVEQNQPLHPNDPVSQSPTSATEKKGADVLTQFETAEKIYQQAGANSDTAFVQYYMAICRCVQYIHTTYIYEYMTYYACFYTHVK